MLSDPVAVALSVAQILEACGLRHLFGGSLASGSPLDGEQMEIRGEVGEEVASSGGKEYNEP